jgi:Uma2 family endonuclease
VRLPKEFRGAADLVGEVLSPSNRDEDLEDKRLAYQEAGVGEIWWIDLANEQLMIDRKRGRRYVEEVTRKGKATSNVLKGFWLDVAWLWEEPLPNKMKCLQKILRIR